MARRRRSRGVWFPNLGTSSETPKTSTTTTREYSSSSSCPPSPTEAHSQHNKIILPLTFDSIQEDEADEINTSLSDLVGSSTSSDESSETSSSPETPPSTKEQPTPQSESDAASSSPDRPMSGRAETAPSARRRLLKAEKTTQSSARVPSESRGFGAKRGY